MRLRLFVIISNFVYSLKKTCGYQKENVSGEQGFGVSLADPAGSKIHPPWTLTFLIIRLKNNTLVQKKMAPPSVAARSLISPGPSNSFICHCNNLQTILTCSLPLYLTLLFVLSILPFYFYRCLCFMVLTRTELYFGNLKQKQQLGSRKTCPPACWEVELHSMSLTKTDIH